MSSSIGLTPTFERITENTMNSNIVSAIIGGLCGSLISGVIGYIFIWKNESFLKKEKTRELVASALPIACKVIDTFRFYQPKKIDQSSFGLKLDNGYITRITAAINIYYEAKYIGHLLPHILRKRWDYMLILVSEYENLEQMDDIQKNRALCDVQNYLQYVRDSLIDFLDGRKVRPEYIRSYLQREAADNWIELSTDL